MTRLLSATCALALVVAGCTSVSPPAPPAPPPPAVTGEVPAPPVPDAPNAPGAPAAPNFGEDMPSEPLALDAGIRTGTLPNGLVYYVDRNAEPQGRAEMRLVVDAGSALEDEDQRGFAHFLEHMLFNGTERFEKNEIIGFLERAGMRFGVGLNAYTSFDETVYTLTIPTDSADLYATAFDVLEDWAGAALIQPEEVEKERGVIMEEWRARQQSAQGRILEQLIPLYAYGSRYEQRLPIGDTAVVQRGSAERMRDFYEAYYRPDRMAVVVVGDIDVDATVEMVEEHFSGLENPAAKARANAFEVPVHTETLVRSVTDPEYPVASVEIDFKVPARPVATRADFERRLTERLFSNMMNARLGEVAREEKAPFLGAGVYRQGFMRPIELLGISAQVSGADAIDEGLMGLMTEIERVRRHGFTEGEIDRARADVLRAYERAYNERETTNSRARAAELVSLYLQGNAVPGAEAEYELAQTLLPGITAGNVNRLVDELLRTDNRLVIATMTDRPDADEPTDAELRAIFDQTVAAVASAQIEPYDDGVAEGGLVPDGLEPATVETIADLPEADAIELTLANGVRVRLKQTDFKTDEVVFTATSPGGLSRVGEADHYAGSIAAQIAAQSGVAGLPKTDLDKVLAGKTVGVAPYIGATDEGFNGSFEPSQAETAMQLIYAYFTAPRFDAAALGQYQAQQTALLGNIDGVPQVALIRALVETLSGDDLRSQPFPTMEQVQALSTERLQSLYADRFADASDFLFTFVGSFDPDEMTELARLYLGNLPAQPRDDAALDVQPTPPDAVSLREVYKGSAPQSTVLTVFYGPMEYTPEQRLAHQAMVEVLGIQVREDLREERGGVYSPAVQGQTEDVPDAEYQVIVQFTCDPDRADELAGAVIDQVERLRQNGPSEENMAKVKEQLRRSRETSLRSNGFWLQTLDFYGMRPGEPLASMTQFDARVADLTAEDVQEAAQRYLDLDRYARFILYPEDRAPNAGE
jgi:zinc protease